MNVPKLRFNYNNKDWTNDKLENIADIIMGQSPNSNNYTNDSNDTILIQGNADLNKGKILPRIYTTQVTKKCDINDIIMTVRAPVGDVAISNYKACIGRGVCSIKGDKYLYHYLNYLKQTMYWKTISKGSTIDSVTSSDIKTLNINYPICTEEKDSIIKLMDCLDKKIELQNKKVEVLKLYKISTINESFNNTKILTKLNCLCKCFSSNISMDKVENDNGIYKLYGANGEIKKVSSYQFDVSYISIIKDGTGVGKTNLCDANSSILGTLNAIIPNNININYLKIILDRINFKKYIVGSGIPHIYFNDYKNEKVLIHEKDNQTKIGEYSKILDKKIKLETIKLNKLMELKKGLMQSMFV